MIDGLKPYPVYKDSGVEWLGEVPAHWEVVPLKRLAWFKSGVGFPVQHQGDRNAEIPFFKVSDMNTPGNDKYLRVCANTVSLTVAQRLGATVFPAGTIVFPKVGGALLTNKRRIAANQCCIDNNMMACVARDGNREFLFSVMSYIDLGLFAQPGPVPAISEGEVREIRVVLPSAREQTAIVRFLDWADRRIRRYIRAKQKLIKLLEEYKQALINQAVTGQIDVRTGQPYPAYKPSGVQWLGDVPAHWEVRRIKTIARIRYGLGQPPKEMDGGIPMLRATNINRGTICEKDLLYVDPSDVPSNRGAFLHAGEIIVVRSGAFTADSAIVPEAYDCAVAGYDMVVTALKISPRFLAAVLLTPYVRDDQLTVASRRSAQPHLNAEELGAALVALPPLPEQTAIVEYLDARTAKIDAAIAAARREIELLREYRERLIADVVTGKVDVREVATRLPEEPPEEEAEEPELLDDTDAFVEGDADEQAADLDATAEEAQV